jgi:hypothetical protein
MTLKVELDKLREVVEGFGTVPMVLTVDDDGRPRAAAVSVTWLADGLSAGVRAGRRSLANAAVRPLVSLLWPAPAGERLALLIDGRATATEPDADPREGGLINLVAGSAILHVVTGPHQSSTD